jgi:hypothetical protein
VKIDNLAAFRDPNRVTPHNLYARRSRLLAEALLAGDVTKDGAATAVRFRPGILGGVCSGRLVEVGASALVSGAKNAQAPVQPTSRESRLSGGDDGDRTVRVVQDGMPDRAGTWPLGMRDVPADDHHVGAGG